RLTDFGWVSARAADDSHSAKLSSLAARGNAAAMIQSAADRAYFVAIHVVLAEPAKPCTTAVSREHGDRALWRDGAGRARDRGRPRRPGPVSLRRSASLATARRSGWRGGGRARGRRAHPDRHAVLSVGTRSSCELSGPARATDGARDRDPGAGVV